jgi:hypothetical protein
MNEGEEKRKIEKGLTHNPNLREESEREMKIDRSNGLRVGIAKAIVFKAQQQLAIKQRDGRKKIKEQTRQKAKGFSTYMNRILIF